MEELATELEALQAILMNDAVVHDPNVSGIATVDYKLDGCCFSVKVNGKIIYYKCTTVLHFLVKL